MPSDGFQGGGDEAGVMGMELLADDIPPLGDPPRAWSPEKRFLAALLYDGIIKALNGCTKDQEWVESERMDYATSFGHLCEWFGIDPGQARKALKVKWTVLGRKKEKGYFNLIREVRATPGRGHG